MQAIDASSADPANRTQKIPITVVVPVKNEEKNLGRCLSALSRFGEVIVVDSGSTDRTKEIAGSHGAEVLDFRWNGNYPKKRNWVLLNHKLRYDWVLFLDADELVDDRFCDEAAKSVSTGAYAGYWLNYTNYFLGRGLRYGLPQRKLAMFKVGSTLYERIDERMWSSLDMEVHEHPVVDGPVGEIAARIDHRDFQGLHKFLVRHTDYARWESRRYLMLTEESPAAAAHLTGRQRFKYRNLERWWYPLFYFLFAYVGRFGFLDGGAGFAYAYYKAWYFYTVRLMIREARAEARQAGAPTA